MCSQNIMHGLATSKTTSFFFLLFYLKKSDVLLFELLLEFFVRALRIFLHHMDTRNSHNNSLVLNIFSSHCLLNNQRSNEVGITKLLSLMSQRSSKIYPSLLQLSNGASHYKLISQHTTKILEFFTSYVFHGLVLLQNNHWSLYSHEIAPRHTTQY